MAKKSSVTNTDKAEFINVFKSICNRHSAWRVWQDFIEMTAIAISNAVELRQDVKREREKIYLQIIGQYDKEEQQMFPELLTILSNALERNQEQDFLGTLFMELELGSSWHGQFFTPYNVCAMMTMIVEDRAKELVSERGFVSCADPACGAGATLIAARNQLMKMGIGGDQAFFVGQDLSRVAGMMCYIQLSLLGCAGYVCIADSLRYPITGDILHPDIKPEQDVWFMPLNVIETAWVLRSMGRTCRKAATVEMAGVEENQHHTTPKHENTTKITKKQKVNDDSKEDPEIAINSTEPGQLSLF